jgi:integrase
MIETRWFFVRFPAKCTAGSRWVPEDRIKLKEAHRSDQQYVGQTGQAEWDGKWRPVNVQKSRQGLSRKLVNQRIDHIKRVFKWGASEELLPASVYEALTTVAGLRRGHPGTYERPKVTPVLQQHVDATLPFLSSQVAAMVQLQALLGARPTEICLLRGRNIDRSRQVWWYKIDPNQVYLEGPSDQHKTAHHEGADGSAQVKLLPIGPKAQEILKPWLRENPDEYLFQPKEARQAMYEARRNRDTPLWRSHLECQASKRKAKPKRAPGKHYNRHSYARAIARACQRAGVPHWHPHQLKHLCGTEVRKKYKQEGSRAYMGHSKLATAEIYAEKDMELVEQIALELG